MTKTTNGSNPLRHGLNKFMEISDLIRLFRQFEEETKEQRKMTMTNMETGKPEVVMPHAWFDDFIDWLEYK